MKLEDKAQDYRGNRVWHTQTAAEYHVEMVEMWAEEFAKWLTQEDAKHEKEQPKMWKTGKFGNQLIAAEEPLDKKGKWVRGPSKREQREAENEERIGTARSKAL